MIIAIISVITILIILLFWGTWGLSSEEKDEKRSKASLGKTSLLLVLTIVVGVFYVKTYNVATVKNIIKIKGVNCALDSNKHVLDTLDYIIISSSFSQDSSKQKTISQITGEKYFEDYIETGSKGGGFDALIHFNTLNAVNSFGDYRDYKIDDYKYHKDHLYHYEFMSNSIPTINPFVIRYPQKDFGLVNYDDQAYVFFRLYTSFVNDSSIVKAPNTYIRNYLGDNSIRVFGEIGSRKLQEFQNTVLKNNPDQPLKGLIDCKWSKNINHMDLLSAADLTQCDYEILYDIDCPTKQLYLKFDIPVIISQLPYGLMAKDSYSYYINEFDKINPHKGSLLLHVQFPTLANMQLIRSLVLTSLLTAFFSLFCLNVYYLVRKHEKYIPKFLMKKRTYIVLIIITLLLIAFFTYLLLFDINLFIDTDYPKNYNIYG